MNLKKRSAVTFAGIAVGAIALAGCGAPKATETNSPAAPSASETTQPTTTSSPEPAGVINVVASTNVYGQLASQIGGDHVTVTSIIDSITADPHTYEATAQDKLAVEQADLVIANGGGYDAYIDTLIGDRDVETVKAVESSHDYEHAIEGHDDHDHDADDHHDDEHGDDEHADDTDDHADEDHAEDDDHGHDHDGHAHIEGFNEHVWFDAHTMIHVVEEIAEDLGELDPANKVTFTNNAEAIVTELRAAEAQLETLKTQLEGKPVFLTEPLPGYLARAAGLEDKTPEGFAEAVEEGSDVAPAVMLAASNVITNKEVDAVLANEQTADAATDQIISEAEAAGIPVVKFTELLNPGQTYLEWLFAGIDSIEEALVN